jgi:hypothetical protein
MVERVFAKDLVPAALVGVVLDDHELELLLPLGMQGVDLVHEVLTADRADDMMASSDKRVDDVGPDKGVGACEKRGRHCGTSLLLIVCVSEVVLSWFSLLQCYAYLFEMFLKVSWRKGVGT